MVLLYDLLTADRLEVPGLGITRVHIERVCEFSAFGNTFFFDGHDPLYNWLETAVPCSEVNKASIDVVRTTGAIKGTVGLLLTSGTAATRSWYIKTAFGGEFAWGADDQHDHQRPVYGVRCESGRLGIASADMFAEFRRSLDRRDELLDRAMAAYPVNGFRLAEDPAAIVLMDGLPHWSEGDAEPFVEILASTAPDGTEVAVFVDFRLPGLPLSRPRLRVEETTSYPNTGN